MASVETDGFNNKGEPKMPRIRFRNLVIVILGVCSAAAIGAGSRAHGEPEERDARPEVGRGAGVWA